MTIATMTFINMLKVISIALLATQVRGGFQLNYPESAGYNTLTEPNAPCGGADANIDKSNMTFWDVGGGSIYLTSEYKVTDYLFRATLDANLTDGWVNLFPVLQQNGIGDFCQPSVPVPDGFNGQTGILQVIANTTDGLFYQCAVLMFQPGAAASPQGGCRNGSSVYSEYVTNDMGLNMIANSSVENSGSAMSLESSISMSMSSSMSMVSSMSSSISMLMTSSNTSSSMSMMSTVMSLSMPTISTTAMPSTAAASISSATASPSATATPSNHSLKGGAIAGIAIGAVVLTAIIFALFSLYFRRRKSTQKYQEKTSNRSTSPKQFAELSGEQNNNSEPDGGGSRVPYPAPWGPITYQAYKPPQVVTTEASTAGDDRSTTAASGRISGYSDLSAAAVPGSPAGKEQLRAEIERVRKQRLRLEEVAALSEREEELERELMRREIES